MKVAQCHPSKPYYSLGLCRSCYEKGLRGRNPKFAERQKENNRKWVNLNHEQKLQSDRKRSRSLKGNQEEEYKKWAARLRKYSLTPELYLILLEKQDGVCAICKRPPNNQRLHIDHDHSCCNGKFSCGKCIRGLLCFRCNYGLGWWNGRTDWMKRAIDYLAERRNFEAI